MKNLNILKRVKCNCCGKRYNTLMSYFGKYGENKVCSEKCAFTYRTSETYLELVKNGK